MNDKKLEVVSLLLDFRVETFLAVCQRMNYTRAAEQLHITQPAVSQHIKALQKQYGAPLFSYRGKKLALAQAGARNVKAARALLAFDPETAQPAEDGAYPGLEEQVAALKAGEATAFLFAGREEPRLSGFRPAEGMALGEEGGAALTLAEAVAQSMNMESD